MIISIQDAVNKGIIITIGDENKKKLNPSSLISMLECITKFNTPFIIDFKKNNISNSLTYDKVVVIKTQKCPINYDIPIQTGLTTFYNFKLESSSYPNHNLDLWAYINVSLNEIAGDIHKKMSEGWITNININLLWNVFPKKCIWEGNSILNNNINNEIVYRIYKHSLIKNSLKLIF